jgi:thioredoxin-related protein
MRYTLLLCLIFTAIFCSAQNDSGIVFENYLSWSEIKQKAKDENKFIFVDCYATWCAPCKAMDKDVFTKAVVGQFMNDNFISVKVQFDQTKADNYQVKQWRPVADEIMQNYQINVLPSFLFFAPNGKIVHRSAGYFNPTRFIVSAQYAIDPTKQYYTLLEKYNNSQLNFDEMRMLAEKAKEIGDSVNAYRIAFDYIKTYLFKLPEDQLYIEPNIQFVTDFTPNIYGPGFELFLNHSKQVDKATHEYYTRDEISFLISTKLKADGVLDGKEIMSEPKWKQIQLRLKKLFGLYWSDMGILYSKILYYSGRKDWTKYCRALINFVDQYGVIGPGTTSFKYNCCAGWIWERSTDKKQLQKALAWSARALEDTADTNTQMQTMDTRANILFKLGKTREAITLEERAITYSDSVSTAHRTKNYFHDELVTTLQKMKRGQPTW